MPQHKITKEDLEELCDDIAATFPDASETACQAMRHFIMQRLNKTDWMERSQLIIAQQNIEKWFEAQEPEEKEHFQNIYEYTIKKLEAALQNPLGLERLQ
jgi:hypothetical protein